MSKTLNSLAQLARRLLLDAKPISAIRLRLLAALSDQDIEQLDHTGSLSSDRLDSLGDQTGNSSRTIQLSLGHIMTEDLSNYVEYYQAAHRQYRSTFITESRITRFLADQSSSMSVHFLLHAEHNVWDPQAEELSEFVIEEAYEDDAFPAIVEGYLVAKGLAFSTVPDLLETSYTKQWQNWQALWDCF